MSATPHAHDDHANHDDHDHGVGGHADHHHAAPARFDTAFAIGTVLNLGFVIAEAGYGFAANSVALLADAAHNLGDVLGLVLAWGAAWLGRRAPSIQRTYGWGRSSILAALINSSVLLISVGAIALEAVRRFSDPQPVTETTVIWVAALGIAINGVTAWLFSRGHDDLNIRATFLHMASDAVVSLGVVIAAVVIWLTGWMWVDPLTSLIIAGIILVGTWGVLRESVNLAMDGVPVGVAHTEVQAYLSGLPGVIEVHDLHIWGLSTTETALTAHLVHAPDADGGQLIRLACHELTSRFRIGHATLQMETAETAEACRLRPADVV